MEYFCAAFVLIYSRGKDKRLLWERRLPPFRFILTHTSHCPRRFTIIFDQIENVSWVRSELSLVSPRRWETINSPPKIRECSLEVLSRRIYSLTRNEVLRGRMTRAFRRIQSQKRNFLLRSKSFLFSRARASDAPLKRATRSDKQRQEENTF